MASRSQPLNLPEQEASTPLIASAIRHSNQSSDGRNGSPPNAAAAYHIQTDLHEAQGFKIALMTQWALLVVFLSLFLMVILIAPPWHYPDCDLFQTYWSLIWSTLMIVHIGLLVSMSHMRCAGRRPPRPLYHMQRGLRSLNTVWFFCGIKPLYWDAVCNETCLRVGRSLWLLQASFFLVPLFCFLLLCLCFPCIVILLQRLRPPSPNEIPTPEWIINKLEVHKYLDLLQILRLEYGAELVEFFPPVHALSHVVRQNPFVEAIATAAISTGIPSPSTVAPRLVSIPTTEDIGEGGCVQSQHSSCRQPRLMVEKTCPICMSDFESNDTVMIMPCDKRHFFHVDCIVQWLKNSQNCPICRSNIVALLNPNGQSPSNTTANTNRAPLSPSANTLPQSSSRNSNIERSRSTVELSTAHSTIPV